MGHGVMQPIQNHPNIYKLTLYILIQKTFAICLLPGFQITGYTKN